MDEPHLHNFALTERERSILKLLANGMSDSEIAEAAVLTVGTVKWYNRQIYNKLGVRNRTQAITQAQERGLLESARPDSERKQPKHNLPARVTSFIGRTRELEELKLLLLTSRLVTLTGPPGTGKTRLALEVAAALLTNFRDGAYFVSLAPIRESSLVANSVAQVFDLKEAGRGSLLNALKDMLRSKRLLLVLDNFEHLLPAAPLVTELLAAAPQLTVLVTSRELLHLYGEYEYPVPPLQLPDLKMQPTPITEAVELFVQRARAAAPSLTYDASNAASIAIICVHLDGLPLAIELAAARVKFYAPQNLLLRLSSRLETLSEGPRDLPTRQRTLRATLTWSYDLLDEEEKILFARLGVFAGGCTLSDAEAVCNDSLKVDVAVGLESLVNKSLLRQEQGDEPRFMMLETMREYALERLEASGETAKTLERHARHFLALAENVAQSLYGADAAERLIQLEAQHDNFRAALRWSLMSDDGEEMALRFIARLARFWEIRGYLSEGRAWLEEALDNSGVSIPTKIRADALHGIGDLTYLQCDYATTRALHEEALKIYQELDEPRGVANSLVSLGEVASEIGDYSTAMAMFREAQTIMRELDDLIGRARTFTQLGFGALRLGDFDQAGVWLEEGMALYEQANYKMGTGLAASGLGEIALRQNDLAQATLMLEKSLALRQELHQKWGIAATLGSLAWVAIRQSDFGRAAKILEESLLIRHEVGDKGGMAWCLEKFAEMANSQGNEGRAARIYGAAAALRATVNSVIDPADQPAYRQIIDEIRAALTAEIFDAVWAEGKSIPVEQIIDYVLSDDNGRHPNQQNR